jgi:polyhydroxybutyrate depolymerase
MRPRYAFLAFCSLLTLAVSAGAQSTVTLNFSFKGTSRNAVVYVPSGINKPPVVYFVHGYGGNGSGFANDTKGNKVADREKFIAIYPSAIGGSWSMQDTADYPFLEALLDTVDKRYKVDRSRVYCTGFSQGGFISNGVGYKHPEIFAAVAPTSGHLPSFPTNGPLSRPVPTLTTFGTNDVSDVASFMKDINTWLKLNNCDLSTKKSVKPYPATNPNSLVARTTYTCAQGAQVAYDSCITGGHEWPMDVNKKVNTTEEVWAFFKQFSLQGNSSILSPSGSNQPLVASYRAGKVHLEGGIKDGIRMRVSNLDGRVVATAAVSDGAFEWRNNSHGTYLVTPVGDAYARSFKVTIP